MFVAKHSCCLREGSQSVLSGAVWTEMSWSWVCCRALTQQNKQQHVRPFNQQSVQHCDVFEFSSPGRNLQTTKKKRSEARSRKVGIVEVHSMENGKQTPHTLFEITSRSFNLFLGYFFSSLTVVAKDAFLIFGYFNAFSWKPQNPKQSLDKLFADPCGFKQLISNLVCLSAGFRHQIWWATWQQGWSRGDEVLCVVEQWASVCEDCEIYISMKQIRHFICTGYKYSTIHRE